MEKCSTTQREDELTVSHDWAIGILTKAYQNAIAISIETRYAWHEVENIKKRMEMARRASILRLPDELIERIGWHVPRHLALDRLSRTCRRVHDILSSMLFHRVTDDFAATRFLYWYMKRGRPDPVHRAISMGVRCFNLQHLQEAARSGNCAMVTALLSAENVIDEWRASLDPRHDPICIALAHKKEHAAALLLNYIKDEDLGSNRSWLHEASRSGDLSFVRLLLRNGVEASTRNAAGETALWYAVEAGRVEVCRVLQQHGASPNEGCDAALGTCLQKAAEKGYAEIVDLLLRHGATLLPSGDSKEPLILAVESGSAATIERLIEAGCNVAIEHHGKNLLQLAALRGQPEALRVLLKHELDVNGYGCSDYSPLHWAVLGGSLEAIRVLAAHGADLDAVDESGNTPLMRSLRCRDGNNVTKLLVSLGANVHCVNSSGNSLIHEVKDDETWQLLLDGGADPNAKDENGDSGFFNACYCGNLGMMKLMISGGADVNAVDSRGRSPLHCAASGRTYGESVRLLVECGADVNAVVCNDDKRTPLHDATSRGLDEASKILIEAGADVNARDDEGGTPLLLAADECSDEVIQLLLENGADPNATWYNIKMTPLLVAASWSPYPPEKRVRLMLKYGADAAAEFDGHSAIHKTFGCRNDETEAIKELVRHGVDVNLPTSEGETPLMLAAARGRDDLVAWLLENGADPTLRSTSGKVALQYARTAAAIEAIAKSGAGVDAMYDEGETPLHYAASSLPSETVRCLLENGADVSLASLDGRTALHYAVESQNCENVRMLLQYGASVNARDHYNETPLSYARRDDFRDVVKVLLEYVADGHPHCDLSSP